MPCKPLCIVDTCSLIYMSDMELARRPLLRWLFDEFETVYSQFVWENEVQPHLGKMGKGGQILRRGNAGAQKVWRMPGPMQYERALFSPFSRVEQKSRCSRCGQAIMEERTVIISLGSDEDRGERHNCGVALDAVRRGNYRQVVYLTDDHHAIQKYAQPVFDIFPLGCVWSSYDLVLYLFVRHCDRMIAEDVEVVFRDLTAKAVNEERQQGISPETQQIWQQRLAAYIHKLERVAQVMKQLP